MQLDERKTNPAEKTSAHRRHPRHHLASPLHLWRRMGNGAAIPGIGLEISESGISVVVPEELSIGEQVEFAIQLPGGHFRTTGIVRNKMMFRYGLEFQGLSSMEQRQIRDTCASLPLYSGPEY